MKYTGRDRSMLKLPIDYTVIDFETTGLSPLDNEIIEIGAVAVRNSTVVDSFSMLVKPRVPISPFISSLTGITNEAVKNAPNIENCLPELLDFIGDDVVIGHNVTFDLGFLNAACERCTGRSFPNDYVDTLRISRKLYPQERHHRLCDLEKRFGLKNDSAHRALSDVMLTYECYRIMQQHVASIPRPCAKERT